MAKFVFTGDDFIDLANPDLSTLWVDSHSVFHSGTTNIVDTGDTDLVFQGSGFTTFDSHGYATSGAITKFGAVFDGDRRVDVSGLSMDAGDLQHAIKFGNTTTFIDLLWGANDTMTLNKGGAWANGFGGNDKITGKEGFDAIQGGDGNDVLKGAAGGDSLEGGQGRDTLFGGTSGGSDSFIYKEVSESTTGSIDTIRDLESGDEINLDAIDADTGTVTDDAFFIASSFHGIAGELTLTFNAGQNRTVIRATPMATATRTSSSTRRATTRPTRPGTSETRGRRGLWCAPLTADPVQAGSM